jgi:hypothetical protein
VGVGVGRDKRKGGRWLAAGHMGTRAGGRRELAELAAAVQVGGWSKENGRGGGNVTRHDMTACKGGLWRLAPGGRSQAIRHAFEVIE